MANPGLAVARSSARTGQRRSTKAWLPPDITQAKAVAGDKYVALAGSQATQQCLRAGLLDEIQGALVPLLLGGGVRLFAHIGGPVRMEIVSVLDAPGVTHSTTASAMT